MPKLKNNPITKEDLIEYLESCSDFNFELSVLKMLKEHDIICEHGGLYKDPVTGKYREFDIRAEKTISNYRIRLAIECKNIRENFPVLVSCIPRQEIESYHQIAILQGPKTINSTDVMPSLYKSRVTIINIKKEYSIYKPGQPVGKNIAQVGRTLDNSISSNDNQLYDKWSQALGSVADLVSRIYRDGKEENYDFFLSTVIPIVVIPDSRLWIVSYDYNGNRKHDPKTTDRCSFFIDKDYILPASSIMTGKIRISHLELMTLNGLRNFINSFLESEEGITAIFSQGGIISELQNKT